MARTRWPPGREPWPLAQARQHRDGTAGGCQKEPGPGRQVVSQDNRRRQPNIRSGRDPGHRPYARTRPNPGKQGRKHASTSSLPSMSVSRNRWGAAIEGADHPFSCAVTAARHVPRERWRLDAPTGQADACHRDGGAEAGEYAPACSRICDGDDGAQGWIGAVAVAPPSPGASAAGSCSREVMASLW